MSFLDEEAEESSEHTLLVIREVSVFILQDPAPVHQRRLQVRRVAAVGQDLVRSLRVVSRRDRCEIRLEDPGSGDLFAACFVLPGQREGAVETVLDSSLNVALSDREKHVKREGEKESSGAGEEGEDGGHIDVHPAVNHRLKEGKTIRINVKNKPASGPGMLSASGLSAGGSGIKKPAPLLAPPPTGTGKLRSALPPPPNDPAVARMTSGHGVGLKVLKYSARGYGDSLSDLSQIERSLSSTTGSGSANSTASGWAAF